MDLLHDPGAHYFGSDNYAGAHPEVMHAVMTANGGHVVAYGADPYTTHLQSVVQHHFGDTASCWPVFNGTGANVVALSAMTDRWDAVIATSRAHIHTDECGAPEKVAGIKVVDVPCEDAILTPERIDCEAYGFGFEHHAQPKVVSMTQSTEIGSVYTLEQIRAVVDHAHSLGMFVHLDGARIANAAAHLDVSLAAMTTDLGVDVISLGGTKAGLMGAEAVVVINQDAVRHMPFVRKLSMQLASKMRFVSAQLIAMYEGELWRECGGHANAMAQQLADQLSTIDGVQVTRGVQANAVFATLPRHITAALQQEFHFYVWDERSNEVRLMCSWDTTQGALDALVQRARELVAASPASEEPAT